MGFCIKPVSNSFSSARPNGSTNRAADHGTHRTTDTGSNSRTSLSPSPATGGRVGCVVFLGLGEFFFP